MDLGFVLDIVEKLANMVQTLFNWFGQAFSVLGNEYSILGLLGGVGLVALIIYSVVKL